MDENDTPLMHELVSERSRRWPGAIAVVAGDESLTYRELEERSVLLAARLQESGVGPESVVGLCLPRGVELVVAQLAVLKAGGAFLPLAPGDPGDRLAHMVADSGARVVLAEDEEQCGWADEAECVVLTPGRLSELPPREPDPVVASAEAAAYVIYTSGSTGMPKGVVVPHRGLTNVVASSAASWGIGPGTRVAQAVSQVFDVSVLDVFAALASGAELHLAMADDVSGRGLERFIRDHGIDVMQTVPALWSTLDPASGTRLRRLVIGGEPLPAELIRRWDGLVNAVHHVYGLTESAVISTEALFAPSGLDSSDTPVTLPIGSPIENTTVHVLDELMRPVPDGVRGEIFVGGAGVARGYVKRPGLTAERFVPDPFSDVPGSRLYRTGDLGRRTASGEIEFLGRADGQVKIRGFRVECGEVEARLLSIQEVREAAVVVREDRPGDQRLTAYVVQGETALQETEVRARMRRLVPDYMVPSAVVTLPALPKTSSGKVDRRALPDPAATGPSAAPAEVEGTPVERVVARIWSEVLGLDGIGLDDDFFELGGHSLLAGQVVARLREECGAELELSALLQSPTIRELAERVGEAGEVAAGPVLHRYDGDLVGRADLPMSFGQQRIWFLSELVPGEPFYNMAMAFRLRGPLDVDRLGAALDALVERHEMLRTTFPSTGGTPVPQIAPAASAGLSYVDVADADEARRLAEEFGRSRFDLGGDLLFRARLHRLSEEDHVLVVATHHIVADGWSMSLLCRELGVLYGGGGLADFGVRFVDFAGWQREFLSGEVLEGLLGYWRGRLAGLVPLELPADRARPALLSFSGHRLDFEMPSGLVDGLQRLARDESATLFMVLLAAFDGLLVRWSGQEDVAVGVPVAGRSHREWESLVGFFVNTLVLRTDCSGDPSFRDLLGRVRGDALGAFDHQDLPFERLVEELAPRRDLSRNPLTQILFQVVQPHDTGSAAQASLRLRDVEAEHFHLDLVTTRADVEMHLVEHDDGRWTGLLVYSTDLFDDATMARLWDGYVRVLEQVAADPSIRLSQLDLLTEPERRLLTKSASASRAPLTGPSLPEIVAERSPDGLAVEAPGAGLTYGELQERAGVLASALREAGAAPGVLVGVSLQDDPEQIVAELAVLMTGAAVSPPGLQVPTALTVVETATDAPKPGGVIVEVSAPPSGPPVPGLPVAPQDAAYVLPASEGPVMLSHAACVNAATWFAREQGLDPGDRCAILPETAATTAVGLRWAALSAGSVLVQAPSSPDEHDLAKWLTENRITVAAMPLAQAEKLYHSSVCEGLRLVVTEADPLLEPPSTRFAATVLAGYGVPEYGGMAVAGTIEAEQPTILQAGHVDRPRLAAGVPIAGAGVYVLDDLGRPTPVGVMGWIHLTGEGLAHGYPDLPARTAERFVPDPFAAAPGSRMFRTGRRGRWRSDGTLELEGRRAATPPAGPGYTAPRNPAERMIAQIWADVLGRPSVGVYDGFSDLGGDTSAAVEVARRLTARLQTEVDPDSVLAHPTIAEFVAASRRRSAVARG
ncbi:amino acid adenylation domain-containing protein [Actinocorallia sp. B10E7]|uniref:amino acid adenylation domain-containing protein n=1 Tax=Actinocorallia sp. B10E7 TaxID=3153558 RepID=UPI00325DC6B9